jgi:hypothetical protein
MEEECVIIRPEIALWGMCAAITRHKEGVTSFFLYVMIGAAISYDK